MPLVDLGAVHKPDALVVVQIVPTYRVEGRLAAVDLDLLPAGEGAEAIAICHHHGTAALQQLGKFRVVDLASGQHDTGTEGEFRLRPACFQLRQRLLQIRQDQVMGTDLTHQDDDVVFIAGDDRVFRLAEVADLRDDPAETVVLFNGGTNRIVIGIHAEAVAQGVQYLCFQLCLVVIQAGPVAFHGWVDDGGDEAVVLHRLQQGKMLLHALHGGAALRAEQGVEVVIAALDGTLQDAADVGTVAVGHVVGGDLGGAAVGGAEAAGEAAGQVQQHLGDIVAVISQGQLAAAHRLLHQVVVGLLQQLLEKDQVL